MKLLRLALLVCACGGPPLAAAQDQPQPPTVPSTTHGGTSTATVPTSPPTDADLPIHDEAYQLLDRLDIKGALPAALPSEIKPYARERVVELLRGVDTTKLGPRDKAWLDRTRFRLDDAYTQWHNGDGDTWYQQNFWGNFFRNQRDVVAVRDSGFRLFVSPAVHWSVGQERLSGNYTTRYDETKTLYRNINGLTFRGGLGKKLGFYAEVLAAQQILPAHGRMVTASADVVPGEAYWKTFKTDAVDYFTFRGYLTYTPAKFLRIKFGQDQSFWGNGIQSLWLSDNAPSYLLLNLHWRVWKLEYINQFTQMVDYIRNKPDAYGAYPRKYGMFHQLIYRLTKNISVSVWEGTMLAANQPNGDRGLEISYLNPLIFYRALEQYQGSPDNSALGLSARGNFWGHLQVYGQFMLDDYNLSVRNQGSGWRGNKYSAQLGAKYVDVLGVETLDLQVEGNIVRPYTYGHSNLSSNWSHYGQALAHSYGTNLRDVTVQVSYQPIPKLYLSARGTLVEQGENDTRNWGGDIFAPEVNFARDFGNTIGQGVNNRTTSAAGRVTYQLTRGALYLDGELLYRDSPQGGQTAIMASLRYNLPWRPVQWFY